MRLLSAIARARSTSLHSRQLSRSSGGDEFYHASKGLSGKDGDRSIECRQRAVPAIGQSEHVGVRDLTMPLHLVFDRARCVRQRDAVWPEFVGGMREIFFQQRQRARRRKRIARKCRVRRKADKPQLRQRTGGPPPTSSSVEPAVRHLVMFVGRPEQRRQKIEVEQRCFHGRSSRSRSTSPVVTFGERRVS